MMTRGQIINLFWSTMTTLLSDDHNLHYLASLRQELTLFANRDKVEIQQAHLRQLGDSFIQEINQRFSNENEVIRSIALKWSEFISSWVAIREEYESHITQLNEEAEEKTIAIENLQEIVTHLEKKVHNYEEEYEKLKNDLIHLSEKHEQLETQSMKLSKALTKKQQQLQSANERHKHTISTMMSEKELLLDQIKSQRKSQVDLAEQMAVLQRKWHECERECKTYISKLQENMKYSREMENILNEKNESIAKLEAEIQSKFHPNTDHYLPDTETANLDPEVEEELNQSIKLQDEIPYGEPFAYEFHRRLSELNFSPARMLNLNDDDPPQNQSIFKMNMDPYFSHFVLTSQSVKIKEDCEQLLNIDAKPFYSEIVEKRVPMHLWDQWIRNKLKEELRIRKAAESDSENEE